MLFNSPQFIFVFLPIVLLFFFWFNRHCGARVAAAWLAFASLCFYGYWSIKALPLLIASILVNYLLGQQLARAPTKRSQDFPTKKGWLVLALVFNLGLLSFFKYANFFIDNTNGLLNLFGVQSELAFVGVVLPIGISFFTFTQTAYLVDCYRGIVKERDLVHYALFVSYFPHLIAGPILHHKQMMPQFALAKTYKINPDNVVTGVLIFGFGLAKKVIIADGLAPFVDVIFDGARDPGHVTFFEAWLGTLAYAFQLYFDFSGYCDMAIGVSKLFNIALPINFYSPYKSRNIVEFWRRWHMTLSAFLRDYLYIPLGGNRNGPMARYKNLMTTMLLGGLWHGAQWTFVAWGALHGLFLIASHAWSSITNGRLSRRLPNRFGVFAGTSLTFLATSMAWVMFRAPDFSTAATIYEALFPSPTAFCADICQPNLSLAGLGAWLEGRLPLVATAGLSVSLAVALCLVAGVIAFFTPNLVQLYLEPSGSTFLEKRPKTASALAFVCGVLVVASLGLLDRDSPFLYFQF